MKIVFLGATKFSEDILLHLLNNGLDISQLYTIPKEFSISYSDKKVKNYNHSDLELLAKKHNIPCYFIESGDDGKK